MFLVVPSREADFPESKDKKQRPPSADPCRGKLHRDKLSRSA